METAEMTCKNIFPSHGLGSLSTFGNPTSLLRASLGKFAFYNPWLLPMPLTFGCLLGSAWDGQKVTVIVINVQPWAV